MESTSPARPASLLSKAAPWLVTLVTFAIFAFVAAPGLGFRDAGEFAIAADTGGLPHPPGAPTWTISATLFVNLLGFDNPARGTNLHCALWAAITLGLLFSLTRLWVRALAPDLSTTRQTLCALLPPAFMLFCPSFLEQAQLAEQYSLMTALWVLLLIFATKLHAAHSHRARLWLSAGMALTCALAIGNHLSQICLIPLVGWCVLVALWREKAWGRRTGILAMASAGFALGLLVFLWLPLRSRVDPFIDWGNPETWDQFLWCITRQQWDKRPFTEAPPGFTMAWFGSYDFFLQLGPAVILAWIGMWHLAKRNLTWFLWVTISAFIYAAGMLWSHLTQDLLDIAYFHHVAITDWHQPLYISLALCAGLAPLALTPFEKWRGWGEGALLGFVLLLALTLNLIPNSLRGYDAPTRAMEDILAPLPESVAILTKRDSMQFGLPYHLRYTDPRENIWIITHTLERENPTVDDQPWGPEARVNYLTRQFHDDNNQVYRYPLITEEQARDLRLFVEYNNGPAAQAPWGLPRGYLLEIMDHPTTDEEVRQADAEWKAQYPELMRLPTGDERPAERSLWETSHQSRANFFFHRGMWPEAIEACQQTLMWYEPAGDTWFMLGHALEETQQFPEAAAAYANAIEHTPHLRGPRENLAILHARAGNLDMAERLFQEELKYFPDSEEVRINLELLQRQREQGINAVKR